MNFGVGVCDSLPQRNQIPPNIHPVGFIEPPFLWGEGVKFTPFDKSYLRELSNSNILSLLNEKKLQQKIIV